MTAGRVTSGGSAARPRELLAFAAGLGALLLVLFWLTNAGVLLARPLWIDEWFTVLVASHASPLDVLADLRHGADGGAGLYHLLVWALGAAGGLSNTLLRAMSFVLMCGALVITYAVLRRRFGRDASVAGVMASGANVLVVAYMFEGRFYALWVFCAALFAWSLGIDGRLRNTVVAIAAVLLTTSHWYGVITLAIMSAAVVASFGKDWKAGLKFMAPAGAGILAFLAISPLAAGQQSVLTIASWIPAFRPSQFNAFARVFWFDWLAVIAFGALVVAFVRSKRNAAAPSVATATQAAIRDPGLVALFSLTLMPFALAALSIAGRPSMIVRYALPAMLAWAPWVALAMELVGRWPARAFAVLLLVPWLRNFESDVAVKSTFAAHVEGNLTLLGEAERLGLPIVFQSTHTIYPLLAGTRGRGSLGVFLDLPDSTIDVLYGKTTQFYQFNKGIALERDFSRVHAKLYGFPTLAPYAVLDTTRRFLLFSTDDRRPAGMHHIIEYALALFPRHRASQLHQNLLLLQLAAPAVPAARNPRGRSTSR